jgi:PAS domain S-box-containing protein
MAILDSLGVITEANIALCEMLGISRPHLIGSSLSAITHPDDAETEAERRTRLAVGEIDRYQLAQRLIREDGVATWVLLSVSACRGIAGSPDYYVI